MKAITGVMIDIETMGTNVQSPVLQMAVIAFDLATGARQKGYRIFLPLQPQFEMVPPRLPDADTIFWWMKQDSAAKQFERNEGGEYEQIPIALRQFGDFIHDLTGGLPFEVWTRGPQFDVSILESLYRQCGVKVPWRYDAVRDLRTLMKVANVDSADVPKDPDYVAHDAFWDCVFQIDCYRAAIEAIGV